MPHAHDWRLHYPFASHYVSVGTPGNARARMHYLDEGAGQPVLLVHGNPTWSFHWRRLIPPLRDRYRCIAPDHIGCGLSDKPREYDYRLEWRIDDLCALIEQLELHDVTLVVQDWGGAIGLGVAARMPERFSRFVLLNTAAFRSDRMPWRIRVCRTPLFGPLAVRGANAFVRAALWMAMAHSERLTAAEREGIVAPYDSWANRLAIQRFVEDIPMTRRHQSYAALVEVENSLKHLANRPVQLIWGMRDWCFTPWFLDRFLDYFPRADVHKIENAGHWVMEDAPDEVIGNVKQFLAAHDAATAPCHTNR
jgi:cis-3-alkyl-4-acyloxetan-2-one decarboxylase